MKLSQFVYSEQLIKQGIIVHLLTVYCDYKDIYKLTDAENH